MNNFLKFGLFLFILILGFAGLAFYWTFYKPLPDYSAQIKITGLESAVDIHWDEYGVPHIFADNESDLYFATGYVHAQDRLWQMTLSQIAAQGRFSEFLGESPELLEFDTYQRTLGFWKTANQLADSLNEKERMVLQSYSDGVNSYIRENSNRLPVEFSLLDIKPIEWSPAHSLAVSRLMAWELNMSWWSEVMYNYLKEKLPAKKFEELKLTWPDGAPTVLNNSKSSSHSGNLLPLLNTELSLRKKLSRTGSHVGSNAWVADASKTNSGFPLLAGDPHLGLGMPGKWYEMHMNLNGKNVSGATIAGIPVIILGQNEFMAWTFTNIMADDTDFFIEIQDPEDRSRYVADSLNDSTAIYKPFTIKREIIKVKNGDEKLIEIRHTDRGPIISNIYPNQNLTKDHLISMQWTGHLMSKELLALYEINWAENFQDFKDALPHYGVPGQNFIYADRAGNIALFATARLPIRSGNPVTLRKGWVPEDQWQGYIPFDKMPSVINPEKGWIANANNKLHTSDYPYYIATFWEPPSRIKRINEVLGSDSTFTPELFMSLQYDSYSYFASELTPVILDVLKSQNEYDFSLATSYLENWNFRYLENATAATIFDTFMINFTKNTLQDEIGEEAYRSFLVHELIPVRTMKALITDSSSFFDDVTTAEIEQREDIVTKSMQEAILFLSDSLGSEPAEWRWEQLHTLSFNPPLFTEAAKAPNASVSLRMIVQNVLSKGPYPVKGHGMSVNNGQYNWDEPFEMVLGASLRRIVDLSDLSKTKSILPTGQSGNPFSGYFGDQTSLWLDGRYRDFYQDSSLFEESSFQTMKLIPANEN